MKKLFLMFLVICSVNAYALADIKKDSVYYLIDTARTPRNDRLWDIHEEYPTIMLYTIKCPCLAFGNRPTFVDNLELKTDEMISTEEFKAIKLTTMASLIEKAKRASIDQKARNNCSFFIIERRGGNYVVHKVRLLNPTKPAQTNIDYMTVPSNDSTKQKKK